MRRDATGLIGPIALGMSLWASPVAALVDLDGDGLSDVWEILHDGDYAPDVDLDGDGRTNLEEARQGTDPRDGGSFLPEHPRIVVDGPTSRLEWPGVPGVQYQVETSAGVSVGGPVEAAGIGNASEPLSLDGGVVGACGLDDYRLVVAEIDRDRDGLTRWEELALGFDDDDFHGNGGVAGGDHPAAVAALWDGGTVLLFGESHAARLPAPAQASRFLHQATLGPTSELIDEVTAQGFSSWLEEQLLEEAHPTVPLVDAIVAAGFEEEIDLRWVRRAAWWERVMTTPDLVRQRMALALSEILVLSDRTDVFFDFPEAVAVYHDLLLDEAFGDYHDLLFEVSRNPAMGIYLSHLANRKADPASGRFPDENYAREIMQLFSIGLVELNEDGSVRLDDAGQPIPTYTNDDITELAKVFTGFSFGPEGNPEFFDFDVITFRVPMKMFGEHHETSTKRLIGGVVIPADGDALGDVRTATDHLVDHPNTGPFLARRLIQRLVTSNPSPNYLRRVATVFADNGAGQRGDLASVLRAILLDPEARSDAVLANPRHGMMREPFLRRVTLLRAFGASNAADTYRFSDTFAEFALHQVPWSSPTVFNFFSPDHSPIGPVADAGLVAPEFELATAFTLLMGNNYLRNVVEEEAGQVFSGEPVLLELDDEITLAASASALLDHLDLLLVGGTLSPGTRAAVLAAIEPVPDPETRLHLAVSLVVLSPDFVIFK
ncbi:MAG: DUF1800 family protein [Acidobacteriota bacterium]